MRFYKPLEDRRHLGAHGAAGGENFCAAALNQSPGVSPVHGVLGIAGDGGRVREPGEVGPRRHIGEEICRIHRGVLFEPAQNRDDHAPGGGAVGVEGGAAGALHQVVLTGILHHAIEPVGFFDVGEGIHPRGILPHHIEGEVIEIEGNQAVLEGAGKLLQPPLVV